MGQNDREGENQVKDQLGEREKTIFKMAAGKE